MELIEVIHFYLGCPIIGTYHDQSGSKGFLTGVTNGGHECEIQFILQDGINAAEDPEYNLTSEVKPILRKLEDMTEEEKKVVGFDAYGVLRNNVYPGETKPLTGAELNFRWIATQFDYMVKQRFDIFGLIPAGLAIDEKTLPEKPFFNDIKF